MSAPSGPDGRGEANSRAVRTYRALMRLLPCGVREADGEEMERTFGAMWAQRGPGGRVVLAVASLVGLIAVAAVEWIEALSTGSGSLWRRRSGPTPQPRTPPRSPLSAERRAHERRMRPTVSWLDVKLGVRMVAKYPGLSLVSVIGMAVAIAIGASGFAFFSAVIDPVLPLHEGERVVSIQNNDVRNPGNPHRQSLYDFVMWRSELKSVRDLSALVVGRRNLIAPDGSSELVRIAMMSASGFRVARVAPVLGRSLLEADERAGAPPVLVIAYEEWQRRFGGDPAILGRTVRLGREVHTVVGVMPEGFRFPINDRYWVPLRLDPADYERGGGPVLFIFGRLADGATREEAQAELATIGARTAAAYPDTHEHLRPRILPYTHPYFEIGSPSVARVLRSFQLALGLLLVLVAINVAVLVYARTATRTGEIAVRSALGASRGRIVTQLFAEALVLSLVAAAIGLSIAAAALEKLEAVLRWEFGDQFPFWFEFGLSPGVVAYAAALAGLAGVIVGVLPALKATGRRVQARLQQIPARASQMQLGRTWTALIVVQVAVAVGVLPFAVELAGLMVMQSTVQPGYPADELLRAGLSMERVEVTPATEAEAYERALEDRFRDRAAELLRRLKAAPAVVGVTFANDFPGDGSSRRIEVESDGANMQIQSEAAGTVVSGERWALAHDVDVRLFDVLDVAILAGRSFVEGEHRESSNAVIVDRVFVDRVLGGGKAVGRRVRYVDGTDSGEPEDGQATPWFEIVGVVPEFTATGDERAQIYHPLALTELPAVIAVRVRSQPASAFAARLRAIAAEVDPALQLHELRSLADIHREWRGAARAVALGVVAVTMSVLLLSAAGIHAMMSFTVARRRREIGIRSALGADPRRILTGVFARAAAQLGAGVLGGLVLSEALAWAAGGHGWVLSDAYLLPLVATLMVAVGLLAALGPARHGLAVPPTEALREE